MYTHTIVDVYSNCKDEKRTTAESGVGQTSRKRRISDIPKMGEKSHCSRGTETT